jgi:hypothetical protein
MGRNEFGAAILLFCTVLGACSTGPTTSATPSQTAELTPPAGGWCTDPGFGNRVSATFAALNAGDAAALSLGFEAGKEGFDLTPTITDAVNRGASYQPSDLLGNDTETFRKLASQFKGLTMRLTSAIHGGPSGFGPVLWDAAGQSAGRQVLIHGGGKGSLNCTNGKFEKLLLSPLSVS